MTKLIAKLIFLCSLTDDVNCDMCINRNPENDDYIFIRAAFAVAFIIIFILFLVMGVRS